MKSLDTDSAAEKMGPYLAEDAVVLSLQNGVDNAERVRAQVKNRVLPVLVYVAANIPTPGSVSHTGGGKLVIGLSSEFHRDNKSDQRLLSEISALFTGAGIPIQVSEEIEVDLWKKLVMNCAYNAISALGGARYGQMVAMPEVCSVMARPLRKCCGWRTPKASPSLKRSSRPQSSSPTLCPRPYLQRRKISAKESRRKSTTSTALSYTKDSTWNPDASQPNAQRIDEASRAHKHRGADYIRFTSMSQIIL